MIELHYFPGNASLAPHIVLHELALPFTLRRVDREAQAHKAADYLALNPNGLIPVLRDGDLVLFEAAAICLHLADRGPETPGLAPLLPPLGSAQRALAYRWMLWFSSTLQPALMNHFYPERALGADAPAEMQARVRQFGQLRVGELLDQIESQLAGHGRPWLLGEDYSVADAYGWMLCRWTRAFTAPGPLPARSRPVLMAWLARVMARPAVQRVLSDEGLAPPWV